VGGSVKHSLAMANAGGFAFEATTHLHITHLLLDRPSKQSLRRIPSQRQNYWNKTKGPFHKILPGLKVKTPLEKL